MTKHVHAHCGERGEGIRGLARALPTLALAASATSLLGRPAPAQVTFSITYRGPSIAAPDGYFGAPISAGDILTPATAGPGMAGFPAFGPLPLPGIFISAGFGPPGPGLGIATAPGCFGSPPGAPCPIEVDALSYGADPIPAAGAPTPPGTYLFSVDQFAVGMPGSPVPPAVWSESVPGVFDASADTFRSLSMPGAPLPPGPIAGNNGLIDGNGMASGSGAVYPGVGIFEPNPVFFGPGPTPGDNLDSLDVDLVFPPGPSGVLFSLDAGFVDPINGVPNLGTAGANGFLPGAILSTPVPGGPPVVYAPPGVLGLDLIAGPGSDDLDALAVMENGIGGYQMGPGGDVILFSVRRGSAVIGFPDSTFGAPIEPGDILNPPPGPGMLPGIWIAAEWLGLATARSGAVVFGDDMDALDSRILPPLIVPYCFGDGTLATACPCGNFGAAGEGCKNSTGVGAKLTSGGVPVPDSVVLTSSGERPTALSIFLQGSGSLAAGAVFGDGVRCAAGTLKRLYAKNAMGGVVSAPTGGDPSITMRSAAKGDPIAPGSTRYYQVYYRDPVAAWCPTATFNSSGGLMITW